MRPGFGQFNTASSEYLRFAAQYGVKDILLNNPILQEEKPGIWSKKELAKLKLSIESYNLQLSAIENVPTHFYDHIMLNGPNKNMQIENMIQNIENMADVGIPIFGYNWMPSHVWRTNPRHIRGGAIATAFDYESAKNYPLTHDREYSEDEMWESLEEWIKIITPIAEKKNIRLGIHPCDPPVEKLGGIPQLLRSFESYKRLIEIVDSPSNGIEFCQGTFSEMEDAKDGGIYEMIDYFSSRKKILYVHFRNVSGTVPKFNEEFINSGYVDMHKAMNIYLKNGFDSFFIDDHVPQTNHDTEWGHAGRAFANGYIQALIESTLKQKKFDE
ncbi:MAG: TIM barrel protein [SAR202 cluster bacterium]|jgi:mannonate dehydratase|nr:mannonate dehydratase [Chloroflexota bacterium]MEC9107776.1 mannonate dehydratase [Chloroflexota bacterium]MED5237745.1 mannonate dehydratase [Chloroflexota bacterium]MQG24399.1 TIM barrel protein [SAR202 cluster bacterium]MQG43408.1 TIM barrel protein [SAR202 cluster bacterium]|tara:strand:- start:4107 stop:5090 length:984 start_codon:yes stop_codon:yes gene_type:complete